MMEVRDTRRSRAAFPIRISRALTFVALATTFPATFYGIRGEEYPTMKGSFSLGVRLERLELERICRKLDPIAVSRPANDIGRCGS